MDWSRLRTASDIAADRRRVLKERVNSERERRLALGALISVTGLANPVHVQGTLRDRINLYGLDKEARDSAPSAMMSFHDANDEDRPMTASQMIEMISKAEKIALSLFVAGHNLKAMDPIPDDLDDDRYWPDTGVPG
jgi:hypothetical protein